MFIHRSERKVVIHRRDEEGVYIQNMWGMFIQKRGEGGVCAHERWGRCL